MKKYCPFAFSSDDIYCGKDHCQWWNANEQCCVIHSLSHLDVVLTAIYDELKEIRKINQIMSSNLME